MEQPAGHSCVAQRGAAMLLGVCSGAGTQIAAGSLLCSVSFCAWLIFVPSKVVWSSHKPGPGSAPSNGRNRTKDFFCCQMIDPLPVSSLSHLRLLSASGRASGLCKEFRLTPLLSQLGEGRWGESSFSALQIDVNLYFSTSVNFS